MEAMEGRGENTVGSSRIRGRWLTKYWPEAEMFKYGQQYDVLILQKAYEFDLMRAFPGLKIFDLCDPDWLEGKEVKQVTELCDVITTSTQALADYVKTFTQKPVICIPDRLDLAEHTQRKVHVGRAKQVAWFGYHNNQKSIDQCLPALQRLGLRLTVISDKQYYPEGQILGENQDAWINANVTFIRYNYESVNQELVDHGDIVLNPRLEFGRFKFKSNNKTLTAWALGLPVATDAEELEKFMDEAARKEESALRLSQIEADWQTQKSVEQYKNIIQTYGASEIKGG